jgi:hypothetical protein
VLPAERALAELEDALRGRTDADVWPDAGRAGSTGITAAVPRA